MLGAGFEAEPLLPRQFFILASMLGCSRVHPLILLRIALAVWAVSEWFAAFCRRTNQNTLLFWGSTPTTVILHSYNLAQAITTGPDAKTLNSCQVKLYTRSEEMSVDLMRMLKDAVGNQVMNKIGGMVGLDPSATNKAFDGASGAILGGMMKKSKTQEGIDKIWGVAKEHDGSLFDGLGDLLGNQAATDNLQKQGGGVLDMVFGGDRAKTESGVANSLGLSGGIVGKLMALAGPMLMGVIGRYIKNKALNAVGLGSMLSDQSSHLGNYMPAGLSNNLGFNSFLDNAGATARNTAGNVGNAASSAAGNVGRAASNTAGQAADAGGGFMRMLLPLALLAAIGWGLWQFVLSPMMNGANPVDGITKTIGDAGTAVGEGVSATGDAIKGGVGAAGEGISGAASGIEMPGFDASNFNMDALGEAGPKLTSGMQNVSSGFQNVITENSEDAANGLAGTINGFKDSLGDMNIGEMAGPAKSTATGMLGKFAGSLEALMEKVPEALRGIIRPAVDGLIEKINSFGG